MYKPGILTETDPDVAQAARPSNALPATPDGSQMRQTRRSSSSMGKIVDPRKLEREAQVAPTVNEPSEPYPTR